MVCALGAAVLAAQASRRARDLVALAAGFASAVVSGAGAAADAAMIGAVAAAAAAIVLFRPRFAILGAFAGGALAGTLSGLFELQGLPVVVSPIAAASLLVIPAWLARTRPGFAPDLLLDEGLLALGVLGLGVAILPGVLDGWHAAANLAAGASRDAATMVPAWTLALLLSSTSLGALYALWSRR